MTPADFSPPTEDELGLPALPENWGWLLTPARVSITLRGHRLYSEDVDLHPDVEAQMTTSLDYQDAINYKRRWRFAANAVLRLATSGRVGVL